MKRIPVIILVGGESSRFQNFFSEHNSPKSLKKINNKTLIEYVFSNFIKYNFTNFILPLGFYKNDFLKFFKQRKKIYNKKVNFYNNIKDFKKVHSFNSEINIFLFDSGKKTNKANRVKKCIEKFILSEFIVSYGDGVGNVNLKKLYQKMEKGLILKSKIIDKYLYSRSHWNL